MHTQNMHWPWGKDEIHIYIFLLAGSKKIQGASNEGHARRVLIKYSLFYCVELYDAIDFHRVIGTVAPFYLLLFVN